MKYTAREARRVWPRRLLIIAGVGILLLIAATVTVRYVYNQNLKPISSSTVVKSIEVKEGATAEEIAAQLEEAGLIRSAWAFKLYISSKEVRNALQAGIYELTPSQGIPEIVAQLTHGKIATNLVTLLPGQRIDQIKARLTQEGFKDSEVRNALNPATYQGHPALVDKPPAASLEGYLYPDSYQKTGTTDASIIIAAALDEMETKLTPDVRSAFAKQGLSTYEAIILASIVEREVSNQRDRARVAQVFLKRLKIDMLLQSDATASYGAILDGKPISSSYNSPYNTYLHKGLPPTPISNVSESSLRAVAFPASTDWLYFVSGDDGTTHFAKTLEVHESNVQRYCTELCGN
jgi:UPF0755 protein